MDQETSPDHSITKITPTASFDFHITWSHFPSMRMVRDALKNLENELEEKIKFASSGKTIPTIKLKCRPDIWKILFGIWRMKVRVDIVFGNSSDEEALRAFKIISRIVVTIKLSRSS